MIQSLKAGDYVFNIETGECKLIICIDHSDKRLLFSGATKWVDAKPWRSNVGLASIKIR